MDCKDFETLLADALGDELAPRDRRGFEAHLARCARCRRDYESGRKALAAMRALPGPRRVDVERRGSKLVVHGLTSDADTSADPRSRRRLVGGLFRYAASILIAFAAGYALHAGLMLAESAKNPEAITRRQDVVHDGALVQSFQKAFVTTHQRNPGRTSLAKCMIAMVPPKG